MWEGGEGCECERVERDDECGRVERDVSVRGWRGMMSVRGWRGMNLGGSAVCIRLTDFVFLTNHICSLLQ